LAEFAARACRNISFNLDAAAAAATRPRQRLEEGTQELLESESDSLEPANPLAHDLHMAEDDNVGDGVVGDFVDEWDVDDVVDAAPTNAITSVQDAVNVTSRHADMQAACAAQRPSSSQRSLLQYAANYGRLLWEEPAASSSSATASAAPRSYSKFGFLSPTLLLRRFFGCGYKAVRPVLP
jgi:hypothetical protein